MYIGVCERMCVVCVCVCVRHTLCTWEFTGKGFFILLLVVNMEGMEKEIGREGEREGEI